MGNKKSKFKEGTPVWCPQYGNREITEKAENGSTPFGIHIFERSETVWITPCGKYLLSDILPTWVIGHRDESKDKDVKVVTKYLNVWMSEGSVFSALFTYDGDAKKESVQACKSGGSSVFYLKVGDPVEVPVDKLT